MCIQIWLLKKICCNRIWSNYWNFCKNKYKGRQIGKHKESTYIYHRCTFFCKELQLISIVLKSQKRSTEIETDFPSIGVRYQDVMAQGTLQESFSLTEGRKQISPKFNPNRMLCFPVKCIYKCFNCVFF